MTLRQTGYLGLYVWAQADDVAEIVATVKITKARMRIESLPLPDKRGTTAIALRRCSNNPHG
jgi:hypothetical protein